MSEPKLSERISKRVSEFKGQKIDWSFNSVINGVEALESRLVEAEKLPDAIQYLINTFKEEAENNRKAVGEKYANSEDGYNYCKEDRWKMLDEAKTLDRVIKELEAALRGKTP